MILCCPALGVPVSCVCAIITACVVLVQQGLRLFEGLCSPAHTVLGCITPGLVTCHIIQCVRSAPAPLCHHVLLVVGLPFVALFPCRVEPNARAVHAALLVDCPVVGCLYLTASRTADVGHPWLCRRAFMCVCTTPAALKWCYFCRHVLAQVLFCMHVM